MDPVSAALPQKPSKNLRCNSAWHSGHTPHHFSIIVQIKSCQVTIKSAHNQQIFPVAPNWIVEFWRTQGDEDLLRFFVGGQWWRLRGDHWDWCDSVIVVLVIGGVGHQHHQLDQQQCQVESHYGLHFPYFHCFFFI